MKKFIVVIISILFLSVFLMMNYLLWDKDNLLKQQENDKVQQDWLRGQNKAMEANINELELTNGALEKEKASLIEELSSQQRQVASATNRETNLRRTLDDKILSIEALKTASIPILKEQMSTWMTAVSEARYTDSFRSFSPDFQFMQRVMTQESYQEYMNVNVQALSFLEPAEVDPKAAAGKDKGAVEKEHLFERIGNEATDLTVLVRTQAYATLKSGTNDVGPGFKEGLNALQVQFSYDVINQKWYIQSISGTN